MRAVLRSSQALRALRGRARVPCGVRQLQGSACWGATREDALSSGKAPSGSPPDEPHEFQRFADLALGGLWSKVEEGLKGLEGECFDTKCGVELEGGKLIIRLPERGVISVRKDPEQSALVVSSNLHDFYGAYDSDNNELHFSLRDGQFESGGEALHSHLEDIWAKHLKIQVDLEPEEVDKTYGPDPT